MASKWNQLEGGNPPKMIPLNWADWEGDEHVQDMDETMEGIYFRIIRELWKYGQVEFNYTKMAMRLHVKDSRRVRTFLERWGHLFRCTKCDGVPIAGWDHAKLMQDSCVYCADRLQCSCSGCAILVHSQKLSNYRKQASSGESLSDNTNKANVSKAKQANVHATRDEGGVSEYVPVPETRTSPSHTQGFPSQEKTSTPHTPPPSGSTPFDPRTFRAPVGEYSPEQVRRVLDYHFVHNPSSYWTNPVQGNITSVARLTQAIGVMAKQVPIGWTPPQPEVAPTRTVGQLHCKLCRGRGRVGKQTEKGEHYSVDCNCEKRQEVRRDGAWVSC